MLSPIFHRFAKRSPLCVIAGILLARVFAPEKLDRLFEQAAQHPYTHELLFSSVSSLMSKLACAQQPSVHAAYQAATGEIPASITSPYNKLDALEPAVSAELVRYSGSELAALVAELGAEPPGGAPPLEGRRVKIVDGSCIDATEHRPGELRREAAGALPGKVLALYDPQLDLITEIGPCQDGHAQERRLFPEVLGAARAGELWIADRDLATRGFLFGLAARRAHFVIRQHARLPWEAAGPEEPAGRTEGGRLYEQPIRIGYEGGALTLRRIGPVLDEPTRGGERELGLLTNLARQEASAEQVARLYKGRWRIEHAFQDLADHFNAEPGTLAYPEAALFGFALGFVAYDVFSALRAALRGVRGASVEEGVSGCYMAVEFANTYQGMLIAIPAETWASFAHYSQAELAAVLT